MKICKWLVIFHLVILPFFIDRMVAQPPICGPNPTMKPTCKEGCIICDIDGFKGRNTSTVTGELPADFCTSVKHNGQWIAFQAGSEELTIQFSVSNCTINNGLEMGLYEGRNCENYQRISMCDTDVRPNTSVSFSNTKPLIIGQYYWLVIDGNGSDRCDYELKVTKGTTKIPLITESGVLQLDQITCQGKATPLSVIPPVGATEFDWSVNGNKIPVNDRNVEYVFGNEGEFEVCVQVYNVCSRGPKTCKKIKVTPPPPGQDTIYICPNSTKTIQNKNYGLGTHLILFRDSINCDSLVNLTIRYLDVPLPKINLVDSLEVILGESKKIEATTNYSNLKKIVWSPPEIVTCNSCLNTEIFVLAPGKLYLEIWTPQDCYAKDSVYYYITKNIQYFYPNIIKQNSSENGKFKITTAGSVKSIVELKIYDRWGSMVFKSNDEYHEWDGLMNNGKCEDGVYGWIGTLLLYDDTTVNISGNLTLIRE